MKSTFLPYGSQYIDSIDRSKIEKVLQSNFITQGPEIKKFEDKFAKYVGSKYAVACASGTAALHMSCMALGKNSKSAYQGKIFVDSKAQKTDGYQLSKAILLDETSEFNAKPELEIYADDVKCSHGSASGSLDENSIFYLMSRGLNYQQSKELLINGFLLDVIEKITDSEIKNLVKIMMGLKE